MNFFGITGLAFWFLVTFAAGAGASALAIFVLNWAINSMFVRLKYPLTVTVTSNENGAYDYVYKHSYSLIGIKGWFVVLAVNGWTRDTISRTKILTRKGGQ